MASRLYMRFRSRLRRAALMPTNMADSSQDRAMAKGLLKLQWDVCKSPGFPSNRVAAGQVDPPAVQITMVCSLFACCLSPSEAFLFLSGAVCWVFSNAYTIRKNICWFFRG